MSEENTQEDVPTPRNTTSTVEDLITLSVLDESALLENIKIRFQADLIYTWVGSILVSMNPYQLLPIYLPAVAQKYITRSASLPPHIFAVSDKTYKDMRREEKNQSVLISGESGAGKTEATKLILQYLAALTSKRSRVEQMILEASPILEAFGNAKTVRNNNSSRFGRFSEIQFGNESAGIVGARIVDYLLEKSRVVFQASTERNYHVFYQMCAGATDEDKAEFQLLSPTDYRYLNQSGCVDVDGVDDADDFDQLKNALTSLNIFPETQQVMFKILSAILSLGNVNFVAKGDGCDVSNVETVTTVANLLKVDVEKLKHALTVRQMNVRGQAIVVPLKPPEANDSRDALAKALYGKLFSWLVKSINASLSAPPDRVRSFIGILDIFGFENFKVNSFEQFCINYANERLQQHFNQHIFKIEEEEYKKEKIDWASISFVDNQDCLDLIEKRPIGILSILDEECKFPKSTDLTFLDKLHKNLEKTARYEKPRLSKVDFGVEHFAGKVVYNTAGFLDKNKDTLQDDLKNVCLSSTESLVKGLFAEDDAEVAAAPAAGATMKRGPLTVGAQFKTQLQQLMVTLSATTPHYVRCIKPNMQKQPKVFEDELVGAQLRYAGMLETIRIRKLGYPQRLLLNDFYDRYKVLVPELMRREPKDRDIDTLLAKVPFEKGMWLRGITKVFLKDNEAQRLAALRDQSLHRWAVIIQATWKMYYIRSYFVNMRAKAVALQTSFRKNIAQNQYLFKRDAAIVVESFARMVKPRLVYQRQVRISKTAPSFIRGWLGRKHFAKALALDREKKRQIELRRMAAEEALERARMEEEERIRREEEERKEKERQELLQKLKAEADEKERLRLEEEERVRIATDKKYRQKLEAEKKEREKLEKERREKEAKELALLEEQRLKEEKEEQQRRDTEEALRKKKEEEDKKFKERMEELKVREQEREEREEEQQLQKSSSKLALSFSSKRLALSPSQKSLSNSSLPSPRGTVSPRGAAGGAINLPSAILQQVRREQEVEQQKQLQQQEGEPQTPEEPTSPATEAKKSTMEKGNRPTRAGKPRFRASTLGAIHPSYFTLRSTPKTDNDEELSIVSLAANVPRGTHFWNGREADLEGVSGNTTARAETPPATFAPSSLSQSSSAPLDRSPSTEAPIPSSPSNASINTSPVVSPTLTQNVSPAKKRWSGAFATLRARSTSQGSGSPEKQATSPPTAAGNAPLPSPRVTLSRASLSSPRTSLLSKDTAQASPRTSKLASITATLRGTPRGQAQESRMITIDAPLYPLLLTDKSVPVANLITKFESVAEKEKAEKELLDTTEKDIFEPKSEELYSWPSYVRTNFVPPTKGKKKGDEWRKLEHYRKKLKAPLLPCSDEQAVVALEIFPKVKDFVDGNTVEGQDEVAQMRWILDKALRNQQLRSEIYSQIIKQTFENPNAGALERALLLLVQLCGTCIPNTTETFRAVNSFFLTCKSPLAVPARTSLHELAPHGARENIPSIIELEQAKSGKQLQAVVQLSSGALRAVDITSFTTAKELVNSISELLGVPTRKFSPYGLYEGFHGLERLIKPETRVYDVISRWETYGVTMTERNIPTAFSLLFKRYLVLDEDEQSAVERELDFHQAKSEIHKGVLPCREEDALKLAALLYFLDASLTPEQVVDRFIPKRLMFKHTTDEWYNLIETDAKVIEAEFGKKPPRSAVIAIYCAAARQLPLYGSVVFRVQHAGQWALPSELDIAVDRTGLQLLDPISKDSIKTLPFSHMLRWYGTANGLYIITTPRRSKEDNTTLLLQTSQSAQIVIIMNMYFSVMLDKTNEFQAITEYNATDAQYISFKRGEVLNVNQKVADNVYQATNKEGTTGLVPADHLQLVVEGELAPPIMDADAVSEDKATELFDAEGNKMKVARVVRVVGSDGTEPEEAPKEIKRQLWLEHFALSHFRKHSSKPKKVSGGLFKSKKSDYEQYDIPERLLHSKDPLPDSLIDYGDDLALNEEAVDLFSVVQKSMGDYSSNKHPDALIYELIAKGCSKPALRDELYCQLAKQITNNTKPSSIIKGLELINLAAGCFVPSPNLFGCFEDFLAHLPADVGIALRGLKKTKKSKKDKKKPEVEAGEVPYDEIPELVTRMAKDIHRRLETTWHAVGERECAPSYLEMDAVKKMRQIAIKVQMSHGNFIVISIDSSTTIAEAFDKVIKKTQLIDPANYYLYFFVGNAERCLTNENEKVCDLITKAEHLQFDNTSSLHHTPFGIAAIFGIRLRSRHLPHPLQPKDIAELDLVFYQVAETVMYGRYPCSYEDSLLLGGLLVQAAYGDYNPANPIINENTLPQFVRAEFIPSGDKLQMAEDLNAHHASHIGMPSTEAKAQYLKIYSKWQWAEASFFLVHQPRKLPSSLLVVVTYNCLHFMDPSTMEIVESHGFEVLSTWGCTGTTFNVKVGSLMKPINLIFNTTQGSEICLVLKSRVQLDKTQRKYATPPASPSPFPPTAPFPTVESASSGSNASISSSSSPSSQPPKEIKKPTVPALQLNRAKMFNFE